MLRRLLYWLTDRLPARIINGDDGSPYLERYYVGTFFGLRAYIHRFVASDPDRGTHSHPWQRSLSLVLVGGHKEIRINGERRLRRAKSTTSGAMISPCDSGNEHRGVDTLYPRQASERLGFSATACIPRRCYQERQQI